MGRDLNCFCFFKGCSPERCSLSQRLEMNCVYSCSSLHEKGKSRRGMVIRWKPISVECSS
jgi:hypothetical protein